MRVSVVSALAAVLFSFGLTSEPVARTFHVPCEMVRDMMYVRTSINGSRPLWLNLDTGASHSAINPDVAKTLGLKETGGGEETGIGRGQTESFGRVEGTTIRVGECVLRNQSIVTVWMSFLSAALGHETDGTLGWNLFNNYLVRIDYAHKQMELEDAAFKNPNRGEVAVPIELRWNMPFVTATVTLPDGKNVSGVFLIDIGQIGAGLAFSDAFEEAHREIFNGHTLEMPPTVVVGGTYRHKLTRVSALKIGPFTLKYPIAVLPEDPAGPLADPTIAGLIGADALSRFTVTFDYPHRRMFLAPNGQFAEFFETDMSGMNVVAASPLFHQFKVTGVVPQSAASEAGIRAGDVITALDGRPAASLTVEAIQDSFERPGEVRHLILQRGSQQVDVNLHLRRLL